jgi:hypothetical protein
LESLEGCQKFHTKCDFDPVPTRVSAQNVRRKKLTLRSAMLIPRFRRGFRIAKCVRMTRLVSPRALSPAAALLQPYSLSLSASFRKVAQNLAYARLDFGRFRILKAVEKDGVLHSIPHVKSQESEESKCSQRGTPCYLQGNDKVPSVQSITQHLRDSISTVPPVTPQ